MGVDSSSMDMLDKAIGRSVCNYGFCMEDRVKGSMYCQAHQPILADAIQSSDLNYRGKMAPHDRSHLLNKSGDPLGPISSDDLQRYSPEGTKGVKYDNGKRKVMQGVFQYFSRALEEVARVSEFGAEKYLWGGFATVPDGVTRYSNAMARHILDEAKTGDILSKNPQDGNVLYAAQTAWNALARLEMALREAEKAKDGGANGIDSRDPGR